MGRHHGNKNGDIDSNGTIYLGVGYKSAYFSEV